MCASGYFSSCHPTKQVQLSVSDSRGLSSPSDPPLDKIKEQVGSAVHIASPGMKSPLCNFEAELCSLFPVLEHLGLVLIFRSCHQHHDITVRIKFRCSGIYHLNHTCCIWYFSGEIICICKDFTLIPAPEFQSFEEFITYQAPVCSYSALFSQTFRALKHFE